MFVVGVKCCESTLSLKVMINAKGNRQAPIVPGWAERLNWLLLKQAGMGTAAVLGPS